MSTYSYCDNYCDSQQTENVTLRDGRKVRVRPVCKADGQLEKQMFEELSPETRRDRFLGGSCKASEKLVELLTDNDQYHEAFIAVAEHEGRERAVAVAHYALDDGGRECECAVVVSDDWQGEGLGKLMLQHLINSARSQGLDCIYSIEAADNSRVKRFATALGFQCKADPNDYTLLTYRLNLNPDYLGNRVRAAMHASAATRRH